MFERLKKALVDSFVEAIALGWIFAQRILHFTDVFSAPFANWIMRREYPGFLDHVTGSTSFSLQYALPELARSVCLLALGYFAALAVLQTRRQRNIRIDGSSRATCIECIYRLSVY